jgi:hypothetical protein
MGGKKNSKRIWLAVLLQKSWCSRLLVSPGSRYSRVPAAALCTPTNKLNKHHIRAHIWDVSSTCHTVTDNARQTAQMRPYHTTTSDFYVHTNNTITAEVHNSSAAAGKHEWRAAGETRQLPRLRSCKAHLLPGTLHTATAYRSTPASCRGRTSTSQTQNRPSQTQNRPAECNGNCYTARCSWQVRAPTPTYSQSTRPCPPASPHSAQQHQLHLLQQSLQSIQHHALVHTNPWSPLKLTTKLAPPAIPFPAAYLRSMTPCCSTTHSGQ